MDPTETGLVFEQETNPPTLPGLSLGFSSHDPPEFF